MRWKSAVPLAMVTILLISILPSSLAYSSNPKSHQFNWKFVNESNETLHQHNFTWSWNYSYNYSGNNIINHKRTQYIHKYNFSKCIEKIKEKLRKARLSPEIKRKIMERLRHEKLGEFEKRLQLYRNRWLKQYKLLRSEIEEILALKAKVMKMCHGNFTQCPEFEEYFEKLKQFIINHLEFIKTKLEFAEEITNNTQIAELISTIDDFEKLVENTTTYDELKSLLPQYKEIIIEYHKIIALCLGYYQIYTLESRINVTILIINKLKVKYPNLSEKLENLSTKLQQLLIKLEELNNNISSITFEDLRTEIVKIIKEYIDILKDLRKIIINEIVKA